MSSRKANDERRFPFCLRCLLPPGVVGSLIEHHTYGRRTRPGQVVFICRACNVFAETPEGPVEAETRILEKKKELLISSSALRFVIEHRERIVAGFATVNRNGPNLIYGQGYTGPLGAVGRSGRNYYFVEPGSLDGFVAEPNDPAPGSDGIGGAAGGVAWVRFKGGATNVLDRFVDEHHRHKPSAGDLTQLRQS